MCSVDVSKRATVANKVLIFGMSSHNSVLRDIEGLLVFLLVFVHGVHVSLSISELRCSFFSITAGSVKSRLSAFSLGNGSGKCGFRCVDLDVVFFLHLFLSLFLHIEVLSKTLLLFVGLSLKLFVCLLGRIHFRGGFDVGKVSSIFDLFCLVSVVLHINMVALSGLPSLVHVMLKLFSSKVLLGLGFASFSKCFKSLRVIYLMSEPFGVMA